MKWLTNCHISELAPTVADTERSHPGKMIVIGEPMGKSLEILKKNNMHGIYEEIAKEESNER